MPQTTTDDSPDEFCSDIDHDAHWCGLGDCPDEDECPYLIGV